MSISSVTSNSFNVTSGVWILSAAFSYNEGTDTLGYDQAGLLGTIEPTTYLDSTISSLVTRNLTGLFTYTTQLIITGSHPQDYFTSITTNSITLNSADATDYADIGGANVWQWTNVRMFDVVGTYLVQIL